MNRLKTFLTMSLLTICFSSNSMTGNAQPPNPDYAAVLMQDHKDIIDMMYRVFAMQLSKPEFKALDEDLKKRVRVHMESEEKFLYPELEKNPETRQLAIRSIAEHEAARAVLKEIDLKEGDPDSIARLKVFHILTLQHVKEEESLVFPTAKLKLGEQSQMDISKNIADYHSKNL